MYTTIFDQILGIELYGVVSCIELNYYELFFRPGLSSRVGYPFQLKEYLIYYKAKEINSNDYFIS